MAAEQAGSETQLLVRWASPEHGVLPDTAYARVDTAHLGTGYAAVGQLKALLLSVLQMRLGAGSLPSEASDTALWLDPRSLVPMQSTASETRLQFVPVLTAPHIPTAPALLVLAPAGYVPDPIVLTNPLDQQHAQPQPQQLAIQAPPLDPGLHLTGELMRVAPAHRQTGMSRSRRVNDPVRWLQFLVHGIPKLCERHCEGSELTASHCPFLTAAPTMDVVLTLEQRRIGMAYLRASPLTHAFLAEFRVGSRNEKKTGNKFAVWEARRRNTEECNIGSVLFYRKILALNRLHTLRDESYASLLEQLDPMFTTQQFFRLISAIAAHESASPVDQAAHGAHLAPMPAPEPEAAQGGEDSDGRQAKRRREQQQM